MDFTSTQKYVLTSPKKLREVVFVIKNLKPRDAVDRLPFSGKKAEEPLRKVIMTAIANAKQKGTSEDQLTVKEIQISEGPRLKRYRAGARGRAKPYKRRMSHIKVVLTTDEPKNKGAKQLKNVGTKKQKNQGTENLELSTENNKEKSEKANEEVKKERSVKK